MLPEGTLFGCCAVARCRSARLKDSTVRPIFLPRLPEMKPRMLWACHLLTSAISWRLAPSGRRMSSSTMALLLPPYVLGVVSFAVAPLAALGFSVQWAPVEQGERQGLDCPPVSGDRRAGARGSGPGAGDKSPWRAATSLPHGRGPVSRSRGAHHGTDISTARGLLRVFLRDSASPRQMWFSSA